MQSSKVNYTETIQYLYNLQKFGMKFGLRGIKILLRYLGNPQRKFLSIHIAGTNGKGSTASMLASIFTAAGYKTGLYTSPHLVNFNERIRINGKPISSTNLVKLFNAVYPLVEKHKNTFFESVTAIAFKYFADSKVDIAIIETGLGGRLDATNVIKPLVSVITSIGLEHTEILGSTIEKIAFEKGGIIKKGIPCVSGVQSGQAVKVLRKICLNKNSKYIQVHPKCIHLIKSKLYGMVMDVPKLFGSLKKLEVNLAGDFQAINALIALTALEEVVNQGKFKICEEDIRDGLQNIFKYSGLRARLSVIRKKPLIITDVAHNPSAMRSLRLAIQKIEKKKFNILFGLMKDKDFRKVISELKPLAKCVYVVKAQTERSRAVEDLYDELRRNNIKAIKCKGVTEGVNNILSNTGNTPILITGSHFVVGEALAFLNNEKYLTINQ